MSCPNCGKGNILNLDGGNPAVLFECMSCNYRFHAAGFQLTGIDASASLDSRGTTILTGMVGTNESH